MQDTKHEEEPFGCFWIGLCVLATILGITWLILGEINIPYKGVYVTGAAARVVALLWIGINAYMIWSSVKKRRKPEDGGTGL
jgi:hypothetical protein